VVDHEDYGQNDISEETVSVAWQSTTPQEWLKTEFNGEGFYAQELSQLYRGHDIFARKICMKN